MIPNPRKVVVIDFTLQELKDAITRVPGYFNNKYQLVEINDVFNQYTFSATEFLSAGVYMDVGFSSVAEKRTEVTIEVRRKIGAFDQAFEIQHAGTHIASVTNAITALLLNARDPETNPIVQHLEPSFEELKAKYKLPWYWQVLISVILVTLVYFYWKSKH